MRRTSPCTRIIGGSPEDRCRSDALFLTTKASNSVRSITIPPSRRKGFFAGISGHYGNNCRQPASDPEASRAGDFVGGLQGSGRREDSGSARRRSARVWRELRAGGARKDGEAARS